MKTCTKCGKTKHKSCFYKHKECKDGLDPRCKSCFSILGKEYRQRPEARKRKVASDKKWAKTKSGDRSLRGANLKHHYGVTLEKYEQMFEAQNGVCAICHKKETAKNQWGLRRLSVDHSHKSKKVRGLLCAKCNFVLGSANDNKEILLVAALYLGQTDGN